MIELTIPGFGDLLLRYAVFDVNGTLAIDGAPDPAVGAALNRLAARLDVHLLSALTHGNQQELEAAFGRPIQRIQPGGEAEQKAEFLRNLGAGSCVAIGNGRNDALMLETAALSVAVMDVEGLAIAALSAADVVVSTGLRAIELLLRPQLLLATLRS